MKIKRKSLSILGSLVFVFLFLAITPEFIPASSSATTGPLSATILVDIPETIALSLSKDVVNVVINPSGSWGTLGSDYTIADVSTTNFTGYSLVLNDQDNSTVLTRIKSTELEPDVTIDTINTTNNPSYNVNTGLTPNDVRSNAWGYSVGTFNDNTATQGNYFGIPTLSSPRNIKVTDTTAANDETPVYFGAKVDNTATSGTYSDTVVLSAVANYSPSYSNEITSITPSSISSSGGDELTIDTNIDYQDGYADQNNPIVVTLINTADATNTSTCTNVTLSSYLDTNSNQKLRITCTTGSGLEADANYVVKLEFTKLGGLNYTSVATIITEPLPFWAITYMQEMTPEICDSVHKPNASIGSAAVYVTSGSNYSATADGTNQIPQRTLIDVRGKDGTGTMENPATGANERTYIVRKLADGNCWMVQNLDLDLSTSVALTNETTDIGYNVDNYGRQSGRTSWTPTNSTMTSTGATWEDTDDNPHSYDPGDYYYSYNTNDNTWTRVSVKPTDDPSTGEFGNTRHEGNYYSWYAATAGSGTSNKQTQNQYVADSICPKGWRLPLAGTTNTGSKSFNYLVNTTYGASLISQAVAQPLAFIQPGVYHKTFGWIAWAGNDAFYSSSTVVDASRIYALHLGGGEVSSQYGLQRGYAVSVRCVAN